MKSNYTHVSVLLDRSGSMESIKNDTIGGFNNFIGEQKKVEGEMTITLCQFDHEYENLYNFIDIQEVVPLTDRTFIPRGSTALLDSVAKIIIDTGKKLAEMSEEQRPERVMIVIITDGMENASVEQTRASVAAMVKHQEDNYQWQFVYIGANQDGFTEASKMGMHGVSYTATGQGVSALYSAVTSNVTMNRRSDRGTNVKLTQEDIDNS